MNIRSARFDADRPDNLQRGIPHDLVFLVRQRLCRGDGDAVAGVNTHRVKVFNRANDNHIILAVPHDFQLIFLPADNRFLDQYLAFWRQLESPVYELFVFFLIVGDIAAHPAKRIRRPDDRRKAHMLQNLLGLFPVMGVAASGDFQPDVFDDFLETVSFFGPLDRTQVCTEHPNLVFLECTVFCQCDGGIETRLATQCRQ